jgi:enoyl-CoA hydratase
MSFENILFEKRDRVALITMNRPKAMNALNNLTLKEIDVAVSAINDDPGIKGAIITGSGKAFVAGADISQMQNYNSEQGRAYAETAQNVFNHIELLDKPFIAAVNGYALGGGCEISMACDIRIASDKAIFGQPEVNLGLIPCFGGTQRLSRLVGVGIAKELIYTGRNVSAEEAKSLGLVNKVVAAEALLDEAFAMMNIITSKSGVSIRNCKLAINRGINTDLYSALELEKDLFGLCCAVSDAKEGMSAFLEKRPAKFTL